LTFELCSRYSIHTCDTTEPKTRTQDGRSTLNICNSLIGILEDLGASSFNPWRRSSIIAHSLRGNTPHLARRESSPNRPGVAGWSWYRASTCDSREAQRDRAARHHGCESVIVVQLGMRTFRACYDKSNAAESAVNSFVEAAFWRVEVGSSVSRSRSVASAFLYIMNPRAHLVWNSTVVVPVRAALCNRS